MSTNNQADGFNDKKPAISNIDQIATNFKRNVYNRSKSIDPNDSYDWYSLAIGFGLGAGLSPDEAFAVASYLTDVELIEEFPLSEDESPDEVTASFLDDVEMNEGDIILFSLNQNSEQADDETDFLNLVITVNEHATTLPIAYGSVDEFRESLPSLNQYVNDRTMDNPSKSQSPR